VRGRVFGLFITVGGLVGNLAHWLVGGWIQRLGPRASWADNYLPLFSVFSMLILLSLCGLPLLHIIRKREHLSVSEPATAPLSAVHSPDAP